MLVAAVAACQRRWRGAVCDSQTQQSVSEEGKREINFLAILGSMIEDMESTMRNNVDQVYFAKVLCSDGVHGPATRLGWRRAAV